MNVGILTFHSPSNYGAVLQAYALQTVISKMGYNVNIVDYTPEFLQRPYRIIREPLSKLISRNFYHPRTLVNDFRAMEKRRRRKKEFKKFTDKYLNLSANTGYENYDALIVGSDQVWNLKMTSCDINYFLPYALNARKISYAASAGDVESFVIRCNDSILNSLRNFNNISVRESELELVLREKFGINSMTVLDPVLLAGKETFMPFIDLNHVPSEKYILYFSLAYSPKEHEFAREIAKSYGISKVIAFASMTEFKENQDKLCVASVECFLSLIYGAEFIMTTSFHATAFSILFEKSFISIGKDFRHAERMKSLLQKIGLEDHIYMYSEINNNVTLKNMGGGIVLQIREISRVGPIGCNAERINVIPSEFSKRMAA